MGQAKLKGRTREERAEAVLAAHRAKRLSPERFNAFVAWSRSPMAAVIGEELEHFSSLNERVLGVVLRDLTDGDFAYVVLGRDRKQRFRAVETEVDIPPMRSQCSGRMGSQGSGRWEAMIPGHGKPVTVAG